MQPLIKLTDRERILLAALLTLHNHYTNQKYNPVTLNELLFSEATQASIAKKLNFTAAQYQNAFIGLVSKHLITENTLNSSLTTYPKDNKFSLKIDFQITDESNTK